MRDPFLIEGPACISFSGGRTSGYMLWRILQAHQWVLPDDVKVLFCNTGKEREESLEFVRDCGLHWNVPVIWLEYRPGKQYAITNFSMACRLGEPFETIINERGMLPNPVSAFCSSELKTRTMHRFLRSEGWEEWDSVIGYRADEERRLAKARSKNFHPETWRETTCYPLALAGVTKYDVADFWKSQPFDLKLPNRNGETPEGNCDLCFKKHIGKVASITRAEPRRAIWWMTQERKYSGSGGVFRIDRPSYAAIHGNTQLQTRLMETEDDSLEDCACTD